MNAISTTDVSGPVEWRFIVTFAIANILVSVFVAFNILGYSK